MPLIQFKCNACGETFGSFQRLRGGAASATACPSCGSDETVAADTSLDSVSREPVAGPKTAK